MGRLGGGLLGAPLAAHAQQTGKTVTIGILAPFSERPVAEAAFERALQHLGWINGRNVKIEIRSPVGPEGSVAAMVAR